MKHGLITPRGTSPINWTMVSTDTFASLSTVVPWLGFALLAAHLPRRLWYENTIDRDSRRETQTARCRW
jgi:hypothetical protein